MPYKSKYLLTLDYMFAQLPMYQRVGAVAFKKDLTNTLALCKACGDPHLNLKCIHIAGTNGKGTTSHIVAAGLQSQGYKVGVYTSPHYKDFRERIKINGVYISKKYIVDFVDTYKSEFERIKPSFFEMTVALAFSYFRDRNVDYCVIETGLGGRLDSTNIITPILSIITNISKDHVNMLGDTLPEIAFEKAGIIKPQVPVVIGESQDEVSTVFIDKALQSNASIEWADKHTKLIEIGKNTYDVVIDDEVWIKALNSPLSGPFMTNNLISSLYAIYQLSKLIKFDKVKFKSFFPQMVEKTKYMGRWVKLGDSPMIIADSAHNEGGLKKVIETLNTYDCKKMRIVLGFVNDKEISDVLSLFPSNAEYYFAKANIPRGLDAEELRMLASNYNLLGKSYKNVQQAFNAAKEDATEKDLIFVGGSIFVVAEVI